MSWRTGLSIASFGALAGALGDNMVRKVYMVKGSDAKATVYFSDWIFVTGMILTTVVDATSTVVALGFAPSSVVTPFAVVHIFLSIVIAKFWLREFMGKWEYAGSGLLLGGVALIIVFTGKATTLRTIDDFAASIGDTMAIIYFITVGIAVILCVILSSNIAARTIPRCGFMLQRFCTAAASGLLGGNTNISAKAFTVVVSTFFNAKINSYTDWRSYFIILLTGVLAILQVVYLNIGLRKYQAVYVIPITNSFLVTTGIVGGMMLLKEIPNNTSSLLLTLLGLLIILAGILILSLKHSVSPLAHHEVRNVDVHEKPLPAEIATRETKAEQPFPLKQFANSLTSISSNYIILSPCAYMTIHSLHDQISSEYITTSKSGISFGMDTEPQLSGPDTAHPKIPGVLIPNECLPNDDLPLIAAEEPDGFFGCETFDNITHESLEIT
ncbi:hypothetical protein IE077_000709 [Cardiosporidium cionae]|uniref:Uncharacterized protein n=1 Tax=Cardiosporidium cionae TaxID=476202 RepID=A0ABQ7JDZ7_9APIC|nr:hypothetical protein IE077_000709 [Cardiosporidium cionae]|eukprot:KAF8822246.1 hypothetical protein IE077_000709 [Cardiosporidium cionae]